MVGNNNVLFCYVYCRDFLRVIQPGFVGNDAGKSTPYFQPHLHNAGKAMHYSFRPLNYKRLFVAEDGRLKDRGTPEESMSLGHDTMLNLGDCDETLTMT